MSKSQQAELNLTVSEAVIQSSDDMGSTARLRPTVCVSNNAGRINVGASNFKFHLADSQGETVEDLGIALGDQFDLIEADSKQSFSCLLRTNRHIKPNVTYKLCVEAFSETAEIEFEFARQS